MLPLTIMQLPSYRTPNSTYRHYTSQCDWEVQHLLSLLCRSIEVDSVSKSLPLSSSSFPYYASTTTRMSVRVERRKFMPPIQSATILKRIYFLWHSIFPFHPSRRHLHWVCRDYFEIHLFEIFEQLSMPQIRRFFLFFFILIFWACRWYNVHYPSKFGCSLFLITWYLGKETDFCFSSKHSHTSADASITSLTTHLLRQSVIQKLECAAMAASVSSYSSGITLLVLLNSNSALLPRRILWVRKHGCDE
jgi:hypothetical protein